MELGHCEKRFFKYTRKKAPQEKVLEFFSQILLKLHFEWEIQPKDGHNQDLFFQNQGTSFNFYCNKAKAITQAKTSL